MVIAGRGHSSPEQAAVLVHGTDEGRAEDEELGVGLRRVAGIEKRAKIGVADAVIKMFAGAVDKVKGLLVKKALQTIMFGCIAQHGHNLMVMIHGHVGRLKERRDLVLAGSHLVVAGLHGNAQFVELALGLHHEGEDALRNDAEILIAEFLSLGRTGTEQRAAGGEQIRSGERVVVVDEEVFLLKTGVGHDGQIRVHTEQAEHALGLAVERLAGPDHGRLLVEGHALPGQEHGGDAQDDAVGVLLQIGGACHIPGRVATGLESGPQAARREGGTVRLAADEHGTGELGDNAAHAVRSEEAVMLLGGLSVERIKDVRIVGGAMLDGPVLHDCCHCVGDTRIKGFPVADGLLQRLVHITRKAFAHHPVVEDVAGIHIHGAGFVKIKIRGFRLVGRNGPDSVKPRAVTAHRGGLQSAV